MTDSPTKAFRVRPASASDLRAITALHAEVQRIHHEAEPHVYKPPDEHACRALVASRLSDPTAHYFVAADVNGPIVGYLLAYHREVQETPLTYGQPFVEVEEMSVLATHRRHGIARTLTAYVGHWARARGVSALRLNVRALNASALRAYEALGYQHVQHRLRLSVDA